MGEAALGIFPDSKELPGRGTVETSEESPRVGPLEPAFPPAPQAPPHLYLTAQGGVGEGTVRGMWALAGDFLPLVVQRAWVRVGTVESCFPCLHSGEYGTPSCQEGRCFEKLVVQGLNPGRLLIEGYGLATTS